MYFALRDRIVEVKGIYIVLAIIIVVGVLATILFFSFSGDEKNPTLEEASPNTASKIKNGEKSKDAEKESSSFPRRGTDPVDCTFDGRGHDAVLMPSGNYYCRSTEKRVEIKVDGVEKICCVTP